jgi:PAS domain S-box-containing protein
MTHGDEEDASRRLPAGGADTSGAGNPNEETLRANEERLRLAMEVADLGTYDWDLPAGVIRWSGKVREIFGLPGDVRVTQEKRIALIHPDDRERALELFAASADRAGGGAYRAEYRVLPADGGPERWVDERGQMLFDPAGRPLRFIGVVADNTERKHAEVERERLLRELELAVRPREVLLAIVSHDLRTPLGAISLAAQVLSRESGGDQAGRTAKSVDIILRSSERMKQLVADLLDMANTRRGRLAVDLKVSDAAALVSEAIEAHAAVAAEKGVVLGARAHLEGVSVRCDFGRLQQVLANLIGNAIKFCGPGDTVLVAGTPEDGMVRFSVIDSGPGIAAEALPHLFDPYWSSKEHAKLGSGLGLFIASGIVAAHGGQLWVESKVGEGTVFHFTVPVVPR